MSDAASSGPGAPARDANNIGTLRLFGALAVLFGHSFILAGGAHARDPVSDLTRVVAPYDMGLPGVGVAMFFVISGYLVTQSFQRRGNLIAYAEARVLRIYPALIVAVGAVIALGLLLTTLPAGSYLTSRWTLSYGIHDASLYDLRWSLPGVFAVNPSPAVNGSLWTLPVELRMYVLVAIAGVLGAVGRRAAFNLLAVAIVIAGLAWPGSPLLAKADHEQIAIFFLAGAFLFVNRARFRLTPGGAVAAVILAALASLTGAYPLVFAFAFAYVILWLGLANPVRMPNLAARGDFSYGAYLYAFPVSQLWVQVTDTGSGWIIAVLTFVTTMPLAAASWHLVEQPALRRKGTAERWVGRLRRGRGRSLADAAPPA
jgi:peptidoglycan/LPS O-acetylase OafA/YrhL